MKKLKFITLLLFVLNIIILLSLLMLELHYSQNSARFDLLTSNNPLTAYKIKVLDSDEGLFDQSKASKTGKTNFSNSKLDFILPEQKNFWNRWQYSLLSEMGDEDFLSALSQVKSIRFYNSGYFSNSWVSDLYSPIVLNDQGELELEILLISWVLTKNNYKFTVQYDFYRAGSNQRYLEHVVNIITPR